MISSIKHRDYLLRIYKKSNLLTDFETYREFRNQLSHVKELAKRKYYEDQIPQNSRNPKRVLDSDQWYFWHLRQKQSI